MEKQCYRNANDAGSTFIIGVANIPGANTGASHYSHGEIEILQYTSPSFFKTALVHIGGFTAGNSQVNSNGMMEWLSTGTITQLEFQVSGTFIAGSFFRVYGEY